MGLLFPSGKDEWFFSYLYVGSKGETWVGECEGYSSPHSLKSVACRSPMNSAMDFSRQIHEFTEN